MTGRVKLAQAYRCRGEQDKANYMAYYLQQAELFESGHQPSEAMKCLIKVVGENTKDAYWIKAANKLGMMLFSETSALAVQQAQENQRLLSENQSGRASSASESEGDSAL